MGKNSITLRKILRIKEESASIFKILTILSEKYTVLEPANANVRRIKIIVHVPVISHLCFNLVINPGIIMIHKIHQNC